MASFPSSQKPNRHWLKKLQTGLEQQEKNKSTDFRDLTWETERKISFHLVLMERRCREGLNHCISPCADAHPASFTAPTRDEQACCSSQAGCCKFSLLFSVFNFSKPHCSSFSSWLQHHSDTQQCTFPGKTHEMQHKFSLSSQNTTGFRVCRLLWGLDWRLTALLPFNRSCWWATASHGHLP